MNFTEKDRRYMTVALKLAEGAHGTTMPNPAVGAVIVANEVIAGKGCTSLYGGPHAEIQALKNAGPKTKGATLYVTLEPCDHFGKTPPCTEAIIASGIKKVYVSLKDPNPLVSGRGVRRLRKSGIRVYVGLLRREARVLNEDFFWSITRRVPWIALKLALTLDGRIADEMGRSRWITSFASRTFSHDLRRRHAAVAVGASTLRRDDPRLSVRHVRGAHPARIVFSSGPRLPATSYFIKNAHTTRSIAVVAGGKKMAIEHRANGLEIWHTGQRSKEKSLRAFLRMAYNEGLTSILVEGGQQLASAFMEARCVNRVYLFYGNKLLGRGLEGFSFSKGLPLSRAIALRSSMVRTLGKDVMITGIPVWR
jgi:diaminohydroxyphosphoribosylaminopyrimidine deaminase / 5-amino-6-(5-phosphoribosylamino)uracil reductase